MKPNYKNWVPKILIAGMAAATLVSLAALIVFGACGLWVTKTWRIILAIVFAVATIGCGKTLQWSITAYRAFSYDGTWQLSRKIVEGTANYVTLPDGGVGLDVGCGSGALTIILLAPLLGNELSTCYLILSGGMETEKYLRIIDGSICSFQIIGTLVTVYGLFGHKKRE